jgi:hypothetical protein
MPRISPHFAYPALLQDAWRYTFNCRKFTPTTFRVRLCTPRPRLYTQALPLIDDEMGKEDKSKNFTLKVPKGTRDCECCRNFFFVQSPADLFADIWQGLAKMLPSAIAFSRP